MKIWLVTVGEPLPLDPGSPRLLRCGVLAGYLTSHGHEVLWWTSTFDHYHKRQRADLDCIVHCGGYSIRMLRGSGYLSNLSLRRLFEHEGVARKFRKFSAIEERPDLILCSFPTIELAREVVRYGERQSVPVLLDIRDLWPDVFLDLLPRALQPLGRLALFWLFDQTRQALQRCTGIIGISDNYLTWGLKQSGRSRGDFDGVFPIGYAPLTVDAGALQDAGDRLTAMGVDERKHICWYVGAFSRQFDLSAIIAAAGALKDQGRDDVQFVLSGQGDQLCETRKMAHALDNVVFTGWIGKSEIAWLRKNADIGLQPYAAGARMGLANKLFEYMSAGLPIVSSLKGENEELLAQYSCGVTYHPGDHADFLSKLLPLVDRVTDRKDMGERGRKLFEDKFSMTAIYAPLMQHMESVVSSVQT